MDADEEIDPSAMRCSASRCKLAPDALDIQGVLSRIADLGL